MNKQFTASEVRERERFEEWYTNHAFNYSRDPIGSRDCSLQWEAWKAARTDMLEAQEKAVPVTSPTDAELVAFATEEEFLLFCSEDEFTDIARSVLRRFSHPAPSDAERLEEALRNLVSEWVAIADDGDATLEDSTIGYRACANRLSAMLATHSAQAQLPAARVTDASADMYWLDSDPEHLSFDSIPSALEYIEGDDITTVTLQRAHKLSDITVPVRFNSECGTYEIDEAALAAQENPNG